MNKILPTIIDQIPALAKRLCEDLLPSPLHDPEKLEAGSLRALTSFSGARVLEVGIGDGRLTRHYAREASLVVGFDSEADELSAARRSLPRRQGAVALAQGMAEALPFAAASFDLVILSWSL